MMQELKHENALMMQELKHENALFKKDIEQQFSDFKKDNDKHFEDFKKDNDKHFEDFKKDTDKNFENIHTEIKVINTNFTNLKDNQMFFYRVFGFSAVAGSIIGTVSSLLSIGIFKAFGSGVKSDGVDQLKPSKFADDETSLIHKHTELQSVHGS
ncbi:hypothetical protein Mgra_00000265 [Meloidogyne graminicola]|nr:hypothetical protein Mgra_00000265 [Meloidogyne graminicola]